MSNRLPAYLTIALAGAAFAGCGSSSSSTHKPASAAESAEAQIKQNWGEFFSSSTSASTKEALLQNGSQFAPVITSILKSPLAKDVSVKVSDVKLTGPTTATVTYTISLAGKPVLSNATGTAVKRGNRWLVGDASFCGLLKLEGSAPPGCSKS